jgi:hypothetical protein
MSADCDESLLTICLSTTLLDRRGGGSRVGPIRKPVMPPKKGKEAADDLPTEVSGVGSVTDLSWGFCVTGLVHSFHELHMEVAWFADTRV